MATKSETMVVWLLLLVPALLIGKVLGDNSWSSQQRRRLINVGDESMMNHLRNRRLQTEGSAMSMGTGMMAMGDEDMLVLYTSEYLASMEMMAMDDMSMMSDGSMAMKGTKASDINYVDLFNQNYFEFYDRYSRDRYSRASTNRGGNRNANRLNRNNNRLNRNNNRLNRNNNRGNRNYYRGNRDYYYRGNRNQPPPPPPTALPSALPTALPSALPTQAPTPDDGFLQISSNWREKIGNFNQRDNLNMDQGALAEMVRGFDEQGWVLQPSSSVSQQPQGNAITPRVQIPEEIIAGFKAQGWSLTPKQVVAPRPPPPGYSNPEEGLFMNDDDDLDLTLYRQGPGAPPGAAPPPRTQSQRKPPLRTSPFGSEDIFASIIEESEPVFPERQNVITVVTEDAPQRADSYNDDFALPKLENEDENAMVYALTEEDYVAAPGDTTGGINGSIFG